MALVKIQIWSPDQIDSFGGFQAFGTTDRPGTSMASDSGFQVSPDFLRDLMIDPHVKHHVESIVEEKTKKALVRILSRYDWSDEKPLDLKALETFSVSDLQSEIQRLEDGLATRWKNQLSEIEQQKSACAETWEKILNEWSQCKEALLRNHERDWCETLGYVIQKVQLRNSESAIEDLESWMKRNVSEFLENQNITIYLSNRDYERLKKPVNQEEAQKKWELIEDSQLEAGQIRIEAGNAGVIFDEKKNLEKVLRWIETP